MPAEDIIGAAAGGSIPGLVLGGVQTALSLINAGKAKKEAKELARSRPKREISPLYGENLALTESELAGGMSTAAEKAYNQALDRQQAGSLSALLRGGGDVNSVSDIFSAGEEGRQRLAMITDQLRLKQIDNVLKSREQMAGEADKNFIFNEFAPWADKAAANAEARRGANAGVWSGLQTLGSSASNLFSGNNRSDGGSTGATSPGVSPPSPSVETNYELPQKFSTIKPKAYNVDDTAGMSDEQLQGLYNFLNGGV